MNAYASPGQNFARCLEDIIDHMDIEIRHAVAYLDAEVVPRVRRESSMALRTLVGHLERLADSLHGSGSARP